MVSTQGFHLPDGQRRHWLKVSPTHIDPIAATAIVIAPGHGDARSTGGRIAVVAAGASDRPVALEATIMAREMGCDVRIVGDVGVAGLHRLIGPLREVMEWGPHAIVVAAGMDGALPSVIAGLVPIPVIGLPVSVGYGYGGDGVTCLRTPWPKVGSIGCAASPTRPTRPSVQFSSASRS